MSGWVKVPEVHDEPGGLSGAFVLARPRAGVVGETRRVAHVFPLPADRPGVLVAYCGFEGRPGELDVLDGPAGMPCERCLVVAARRAGANTIPYPRHD
ncbi:hypothetical protein GCM10027445_48740 [Amycolatopsis endophytica]|uniref:Uncharacterized protein n=1 Tax=Amycolatopsis endophytica TaxID=860233 RepID=A0A853BD87_9PSEU|nr:hypothetical protein [Amycolatopsis endophytica]NYI93388.1 hypothetical protein [Amycolatopsis endophytica]